MQPGTLASEQRNLFDTGSRTHPELHSTAYEEKSGSAEGSYL